ncbi:sugar phosphate isomerase/epimerase family protein [Mycetocola zhujimingii]|uniref:Sugar phosphate isomerase/epimerase n=1 Tax=Mycetocola zhujimingii TaxID=2079792 RepID=A0A2U1THT6_9MICO|nr:sugar phosphate isomerase/epimerase [Mycetocola zhujimingii]PWC08343.1 sugar phosphate isomerase/epimerase [Mycetocola zhujimingii]
MSSPSVQLYSVRNAIERDLHGSLDRLAAIGFTQVEPYAFDVIADDLKKALSSSGLSAPSAHALVIDKTDPERVFDAAAMLGIGTVIDPFVPSDRWQTADDAAAIAARVNELAEIASERGIAFGYHNHQWEFANKVDGRPVFDLFVEQLSDKVVLEVDTFWATVAGADTPAVLKGLGDRVQFLHIKDGTTDGDIATALPSSESALKVPDALALAYKNQVPAGSGDVDVLAILQAAPHALRVVEFDDYSGDIFDGIGESFAWLAENDK